MTTRQPDDHPINEAARCGASNADEPKDRWLACVLLLPLIAAAWLTRWIQDDAYISFRYARNLVEGQELVWNLGERVEGYTNFLWTLLMAGGMALGLDPVVFSTVLGLLLFAGTLLLSRRLAGRMTGSRMWGFIAMVLLGLLPSFVVFATSGLETMLQAFLVLLILTLAQESLRRPFGSPRLLVGLSMVLALAFLTRMDSAVWIALVLVWLAAGLLRSPLSQREKVTRLLCLGFPALVVALLWLGWKLWYYGDILPNTFYAKSGDVGVYMGLRYLAAFVHYYLLWLILPVLVFAFWKNRRAKTDGVVTLLGVSLLAWAAYVVWVGGDFMEFRFMVPALPPLMILLCWAISRVFSRRRYQAAALSVILLGFAHQLVFFPAKAQGWGIEPYGLLKEHIESPRQNWRQVGRVLGELCGHDDSVLLAVTAAGAIPYYARTSALDMYGLNDAWIARHGVPVAKPAPGHQRFATQAYVTERRANLVIGFPQIEPVVEPTLTHYDLNSIQRFWLPVEDPTRIPPDSVVLEVPLTAEERLLVWYLFRHPRIDAAIARYGLRVFPIMRHAR